MRSAHRLAVVGLCSLILAAAVACSSSSDRADESSADVASAVAPAASGIDRAAGAVDAGVTGSESSGSPSFAIEAAEAPPAALGREVVSTANVTLRADDIAAAKERAAAAVEAAGGYVYAEQGQFGDRPSATMTFKVPPDRFRSVLAGLGELGTVDSQDVSTDDVTEQVIDLDSRIASAEVSVARVRGFLDRATNVIEISSFESELLRRETDLEKLRAQKRALGGRIDLATIVLTVQPPVVAAEQHAETSELPGFVDGLAAGWRAFVGALTVLLVVLGAVLPFLPVVAIALGAVWWVRRRQPATRDASASA
jgi:hypothetical protein